MSNLTLNLDNKAEDAINRLKTHYNATSKAEVIKKALTLLQIASEIDDTKGELIAKKGDKETRILIK